MKNNKNGFTLIELLAVIVILAVIALIATPIILNIVEKARKSAFENTAYGIIKSGEFYYAEKLLTGGITEDKTIILEEGKTSELGFSGTIPNGVITINTDGKVGLAIYDNKWCVTKGINDSKVTLAEYEEGKCIIPDSAKNPVITLNGDREVTLYTGDTYTEQGAEAKTVDGTTLTYTTTITKDGNVVASIDTSAVGEYTITYTAANNNKTATETRTVKVVDGTAPTIAATTTSYTTTQGTSYAVTNLYTVTYGNSGGSTVCKVGTTTVTDLSSLAVGSYTLTCTATSGAGASASVSINIKIETAKIYKCKRATYLHSAYCRRTSGGCRSDGYYVGGSKNTDLITYGSLGTRGTLTTGDAFDCDVDGDGQYHSVLERFYYVSDLYNTTTQTFDSNYAVLLYFINTTAGEADDTTASVIAYDSSGENWHGPRTAIANLPTTTQWPNVSLSSTKRAILTYAGNTSTGGGTLPTAFDYTGYAARLLTLQEQKVAGYSASNYWRTYTDYADDSSVYGYWLDSPNSNSVSILDGVGGLQRADNSTKLGVRPAIEVLKTDIEI